MGKDIEDDEYEVIPIGPIKKLEEKINKIARERESTSYTGFMREILELVQSNQRLVDEIVKSNDELRDELSKIPGKIDELLESWKEFINLLKESGGGESSSGMQNDKIEELIELNKEMLKTMKTTKPSPFHEIKTNKTYPRIRLRR